MARFYEEMDRLSKEEEAHRNIDRDKKLTEEERLIEKYKRDRKHADRIRTSRR